MREKRWGSVGAYVQETKSFNSYEEISNAIEICNYEKIDILRSITSPSHVPRCVLIAIKYIEKKGYDFNFIPAPCSSDFSEDESVVIFEPQSGPGQKRKISPCNTFQKYFQLSKENKYIFLRICEDFLSKH